MKKQVNIQKIYEILKREVVHYNVPIVDLIEIQTQDPFKVLIATILSARTKDETTALACKKLFKKVTSFEDLENIPQEELEQLIFPVGFYKTKAKHLKQLSKVIKEKCNNKIPETIEELIELPGVGRKTANLVVAVAFKKPGMCIDTHCHRIPNRWGYIKTNSPYETEMVLRKKLPKEYWENLNAMLVAFGQNICRPISPHCSICPIHQYCNQIGVTSKR